MILFAVMHIHIDIWIMDAEIGIRVQDFLPACKSLRKRNVSFIRKKSNAIRVSD